MVSWDDGEESSTVPSSGGSEPFCTTYDSDYCGLADDEPVPVRCKHRGVAAKFVCFESWNTGRKFLGCSGAEGTESCDFVQWVDAEWPESLKKALCKLWDNYAEVKEGRVNDALEWMEQKWKFEDEIEKLHKDLRRVQDEVGKAVEGKQVTLALKAKAEQALVEVRAELEEKKKLEACTSNMHKVMRIKAEKERDKLKEERDKLKEEKRSREFVIADLFALKEANRERMKQIKNLCDQ